MPYVRVHIDADDIMDELSDDELRSELNRRAKKRGSPAFEPSIPKPVAASALDDAAMVLRKCGRVDLAYKLDETRVDYLQ